MHYCRVYNIWRENYKSKQKVKDGKMEVYFYKVLTVLHKLAYYYLMVNSDKLKHVVDFGVATKKIKQNCINGKSSKDKKES